MKKGIFILILILSSFVQAKELRQFGETVRSNGMGGVHFPEPNKAYQFLSNPAYLSQVKGINWDLFGMGIGSNAYSSASELSGFQYTGISSISNYYGSYFNTFFQGYSAIATPNFGLAVYDEGFFDIAPHNPSFPTIDMTVINDYAFAMGYSFNLAPQTDFGINLKRITRLGGEQSLGIDTIALAASNSALIEQFQNEGVGYGFDLGLTHTIPAPFSPTISLAWQDVGSTAFTKTKGADKPERIKDNLTMAATFRGDSTLIGLAGGIEYRHINDANEPLAKKIHMGLELDLPLITVRGGLYQGYVTYGAGIDLLFFQIDAAYYTVERGAYAGQTPDKRIQIGISMNMGFDPDFNITDSSGKKRHLKQRR